MKKVAATTINKAAESVKKLETSIDKAMGVSEEDLECERCVAFLLHHSPNPCVHGAALLEVCVLERACEESPMPSHDCYIV